MTFLKSLVSLVALFATFKGSQAGIDLTSDKNVAVYWGQNSYGQSTGQYVQQQLAYYCANSDIDVFQLAFVTVINGAGGAPEINFANAGNNCTGTFSGTSLLDCPQIGADIKTCQSLGKTILLSIGGATYSEGGFSTAAAATAGAQLIWETFGPVSSSSSANRPFGDAVVDGFDFDFESTVSNMPTFGNELRTLFAQDTSKKYYLTAAPQCPYPDAADGPMLDGSVYFDAVWVQFYNNYCGLTSYVAGTTTQNNFNYATWDTWAKSTSVNTNVKVFIGVPANTGAAGSGYEPVSGLTPIIQYAQGFSSFGGIMMWDASQAYANSGFISGVYSALSSGSSGSATSTTTTSTTTKATTTTTSVPTTLTTATKTTTASSTTTTTAAATGTCAPAGGACSTSGAYACNGSNVAICSNGVWVMQACSSGLVCVDAGSNSVYCNYPGSNTVTTC